LIERGASGLPSYSGRGECKAHFGCTGSPRATTRIAPTSLIVCNLD
jgi:hypothetical protein